MAGQGAVSRMPPNRLRRMKLGRYQGSLRTRATAGYRAVAANAIITIRTTRPRRAKVRDSILSITNGLGPVSVGNEEMQAAVSSSSMMIADLRRCLTTQAKERRRLTALLADRTTAPGRCSGRDPVSLVKCVRR